MNGGDLGLLFVAKFDPPCYKQPCLKEIIWIREGELKATEPSAGIPRLPPVPTSQLQTILP